MLRNCRLDFLPADPAAFQRGAPAKIRSGGSALCGMPKPLSRRILSTASIDLLTRRTAEPGHEQPVGAPSAKQLVADGRPAAEPFARHPGKSAEHVVRIRC